MGLFSGKTITTVGTQVSRVIEDAAVPNSIANGMIKNLFSPDSDGDQLLEYVLDDLANSVGLRAGRMQQYGRDQYVYGLPKAVFKSATAGKSAAKAAVEAMVGNTVAIDYYHFGAMNMVHWGWVKLEQDYGYDAGTNTLTVEGRLVYLKDMQAVVTDATLSELENGVMEVWGTAANDGYTPDKKGLPALAYGLKVASPYLVDPTATGDYLLVKTQWTEQVTVTVNGVPVQRDEIHDGSFTLALAGFDEAADYHQMGYTNNGQRHYWTYQAGTGTHPDIDAVFDTVYSTGGSYFPWTYFRFSKTAATANRSSDWYLSSSKLVDKLGMDFEAVATAINENPDIDDVEQAMMVMAVPADTDNEAERRYLFDYFNGIYEASLDIVPVTPPKGVSLESMANLVRPNETAILIQDARFKMALSCRAIVRRTLPGMIGKVGTHTSGVAKKGTTVVVPTTDGSSRNWTTTSDTHWYRRQTSASTYEELQVNALKLTYYVFGNYTTTSMDNEKILLVPVDTAVTADYPIAVKEALYARALHYVFNSRVETKLKWYQTGLFRALMVIVAVVVTIITYGETWQSIAAAVAAGTITAVALSYLILMGILRYIAVSLAVKLFVRVAGAKIAFIAAIVAAAFGYAQAYSGNALTYMPSASTMLMVSTNLSTGANRQLRTDMQDLLQEGRDFDTYAEAQMDKLDEANKLLDSSLRVNPLVLLGETPNDFYQRTVHSGNIGTLGFDHVASYVDVALQLPKLSDTLGET